MISNNVQQFLVKTLYVFVEVFQKQLLQDLLILQLVRSATSVGANYMEANGASSRKDFKHKIHICKKEAQETKHWLRMMQTSVPQFTDELKKLFQECQELTLIFQKIITSMASKEKLGN